MELIIKVRNYGLYFEVGHFEVMYSKVQLRVIEIDKGAVFPVILLKDGTSL